VQFTGLGTSHVWNTLPSFRKDINICQWTDGDYVKFSILLVSFTVC